MRITGVGFGPHVEMEAIFAAIDGEDPRCVTALYDRMLRRSTRPTLGTVFGQPRSRAAWTSSGTDTA
jgi:hypothetical protein